MKGLFIIGNKRSGSTHLMKLLNLHPEVYVSNESDILWILYNFHNNKEITNYKFDSPAGMTYSLEIAKSKLAHGNSVLENFINYQTFLMESGFLEMKPQFKKNLKYIGDQKPYQNVDPEMMPFVLKNIPNSKYIHLLRHPFEVVSSSMKFGNNTGGYIWKDMTSQDIFAKWEMHENWVKDAIKKYNIDVYVLKYDKLIKDPIKEMARLYKFLNLNYNTELLKEGANITRPNFKKIDNYQLTSSQKLLLESYNMKTSFSKIESTFIPKLQRKKHDFKTKLFVLKSKAINFLNL